MHEYCVALANEGGGVLLLGIADKPPRQVVSTQAFPVTVAAAEKMFRAVGFRMDIKDVVHPDGRVLVFHIPDQAGRQRRRLAQVRPLPPFLGMRPF
ncbi:MAG: helix-turn-helix domain-containing protein [Cyanobacteriota bacterium]